MTGEQTETVGHQYLEDDTIMGRADKLQFFMKEMQAELSGCKKASQNPFVIAKLNVPTIRHFTFP